MPVDALYARREPARPVADLTIGHAHRTCLRALPSTLLNLNGLGHLLPVLADAGLVDCRNGIYSRTAEGDRVLEVYHASMEALAESWDRTAVARVAARANLIREQLRQLEQDLHALEVGSDERMEQWRFRGAEVSAQHAGALVWSVVCTLEAGS